MKIYNLLAKIFIISLGVGIIVSAIFYLPVLMAKTRLDKFRQSNICDDSRMCRQIVKGIVSDSKYIRTSFSISNKYSTKTTTNQKNLVVVDLDNGQNQEVTILTGIDVSKEYFSSNTYIPDNNMANAFVENYFPTGEKIRAEIWQGEVIAIYLKDLDQNIPENSHQANETQLQEIIIPTYRHPNVDLFVKESKFQGNAFGFTFGAIIILLPFLLKSKK